MNFVTIIAIIIGLALVITLIRHRLLDNKPATPPEDGDVAGNPISHVIPEEAHHPNEKTIPIYNLNNIAQANTLQALLEDNGIECIIHSFTDYAYGDVWQAQKGWGILKVLAKDQDKAEDLIDAFLEAKEGG